MSKLVQAAPRSAEARKIGRMGRIGRSYPRFDETPRTPANEQDGRGFHALGAAIGILAALAFIGWILSR